VKHMPPVPVLDCVDVREALLAGRPLSGAEAQHAARCPVCSKIQPGGEVAFPQELLSAVESAVRHDTGFVAWLRALPTPFRVLTGYGAAAFFALGMASLRPRWLFGPIPVQRVALVLGVLSVLVAALLRLALWPLQVTTPSSRALRGGLLAAVFVPVYFALTPPNAEAVAFDAPGMAAATLGCFLFGALPGVLLVLALRALDRNAHRGLDVALLAAACGGLAGNAALELHCPSVAPLHLLLGHATVGVVLIAAYFIWSRASARQ
jgi:hypothetical protein